MVCKEEAGPAAAGSGWEEGWQQRAGWWDPRVRGFQSMWVVRKWRLSLRFLLPEFIAKKRGGQADDPLGFELKAGGGGRGGWGAKEGEGKNPREKGCNCWNSAQRRRTGKVRGSRGEETLTGKRRSSS